MPRFVVRSRETPTALLLLLAAVVMPPPLLAQWPQWRGPQRDGYAVSFPAIETWPDALERVWSIEVGRGHSSPLVNGGRVYVFSRRDDRGDLVQALRLDDGSAIWSASYDSRYQPDSSAAEHGKGPFSTPLLAEGALVTYNVHQVLSAWSAEDGTLLWRRDFGREFDHPYPTFGNSQSPIAVDDLLVVHAGGPGDGALFGLDLRSGEQRWRSDGDGAPYGSFFPATLEGIFQLVGFTEKRLIGLAPRSGEVLWEVEYPVPYDNTVVTPTVLSDRVIVAAWETPMRSYAISRQPSGSWSAEVAWENREIAIQHASPVLIDGRLYGHSHRNRSQFYAVDAASGETLWLGPPRQEDEQAVLVVADAWILVFRQSGELEILPAGADGYRPVRRYRLAPSEIWAHPAVWERWLLVKDYERLTLWRVPATASASAPSGL